MFAVATGGYTNTPFSPVFVLPSFSPVCWVIGVGKSEDISLTLLITT